MWQFVLLTVTLFFNILVELSNRLCHFLHLTNILLICHKKNTYKYHDIKKAQLIIN